MTLLASLRSWMRAVLHRENLEREMDAEMRFHLEARAADLERAGASGEQARRQANLEFGSVEARKEECRESRGLRLLDDLRGDMRYALRNLARSPGFTLLALFCLTVAIGANTAVFSWFEGILFRPYPLVQHQERMFAMAGTARGQTGFEDVSWPDMLDFRRECTLFQSFIAEHIAGMTIAIGDRSERVTGSVVSSNYFDALGVHPVLGRGFEPEEDQGRNAHPVAVISYRFWQDRFHGDPGVIGRTQMLNGMPHTIVGVAPEGFYGTFVAYAFQIWVPASMEERVENGGYKLDKRDARWIEGFAFLKPGVSVEQAQAQLSAVTDRLQVTYPDSNRGRGVKLLPLWETPFNGAGALLPALGIALVMSAFVLLIACANVSNLLLVRAFARRHEMTIRRAVGAGRGRLVKQLMTEGFILAAFASVFGILLAMWLRNGLVRVIPPRSGPLFLPGEFDWRVLAASGGVCILSTLLFALAPAFQAGNIDLASALKSGSGGVVGGRGRQRLRSGLVLVQVSLSFVLLVGAGLLVRSMQRIRTSNPGFSTSGVLATTVDLFEAGYDQQRARNFEEQLLDQVRALAGVQAAAYGRVIPLTYRGYSSASIAVDGYQAAPDEQPTAEYDEISPGYFDAMGIPLVSGRDFTRADDDGAAPVAIVNQTMAAKYWRGQNPVGQRIKVKDRSLRIVGLARDSKYSSMLETPKPLFYVPLRQYPSPQIGLFLRTTQGAGPVSTVLARLMHAQDPDVSPFAVLPMSEFVERSTSAQHMATTLLSGFGGLALLMAAIGLYGIMSYTVSQSGRELGLRMALGAAPADLLRQVLRQGLKLSAFGVAVGALLALELSRLLGYLLYQTSPRDPVTYGAAAAIMAVSALLASSIPARRATRTDPLRALRE